MADIAVFDAGYRDSDLALTGMRGLLYEVAGGLFDTFSIDPAADEFQGPFQLLMWNDNKWTIASKNIVQNQTYDLSQYTGAQDKFIIWWADGSLDPDLTEGNGPGNAASYNWLSTLTFAGEGHGEHVGNPRPRTGYAGVADLRRPGPVGLASASCRLATQQRPS